MSEIADAIKTCDVQVMGLAAVDKEWGLFIQLVHRQLMLAGEPSAEQLSVLVDLLNHYSCYVDLGIWGPHQIRIIKIMKGAGW